MYSRWCKSPLLCCRYNREGPAYSPSLYALSENGPHSCFSSSAELRVHLCGPFSTLMQYRVVNLALCMAHRPFFLFTRSQAAYGPHNAGLSNLLLFGMKDEPAFFLFLVQLQGFAFGIDGGRSTLLAGLRIRMCSQWALFHGTRSEAWG